MLDVAKRETILLTGATGYVGGRLLPLLETRGAKVRCLARRADWLRSRVGPNTEVVAGDVLADAGLVEAMRGVDTAFYMVHSMGSPGTFEEEDRTAASNFAAAARAGGVRRIVYLGGLGDSSLPLSPHLRSRHEVGRVLASSGIPTIEFRASMIIGSGSLSFELVRALSERLPVMVTPRWVSNPAQPIAIGDVLQYLLAAIEHDCSGHVIYEIGGRDVVSYGDCLDEYARQRGLRRLKFPVPVLTPRLSSLWLGLVTPLYARVGRKLIDSIYYPTVVRDDAARRAFPIEPLGLSEAMAAALRNEDAEFASTHWSDALSAASVPREWGGVRLGNRLVDSRVVHVDVAPSAAFAPVRRIGGRTGWYFGDWLWQLRGAIDLLIGGVGMRRGRRDPETLRVGDVLDCWRVEAFEPDRLLRLQAEMKLPGRAWLQFEVEPDGDGSLIRQTALFDPAGVAGLAYWYGIYFLHEIVFARMLAAIADAARAERQA